MRFETHIAVAPENLQESSQESSPQSLKAVELICSNTELTKARAKQVMQQGAVWLTRNRSTQRIRRADKRVVAGDELHVYYDDNVLLQTVQPARLIADESEYSILFKPFGMLSQGSRWGDHTTVYRWAEQNLQPQRPAFVVHRLDRAASGLMIIAHQKKAAAALAALFEKRQITKQYQAIVAGHFADELQMDTPLAGREALSVARRVDYDDIMDRSLLEVEISTGRKHQIRQHLAAAGFPIIGDRMYGKDQQEEDLQLRSFLLAFESPIDQQDKTYRLPLELGLSLQNSQGL